MTGDLRIVIWKEWRSLIHGQNRRQLVVITVSLAFWAVWLPIQTGSGWMTDGVISILISAVLPALVVAVTVPAAFAGERESKTLGTLLATRLPDEAILFGKLVVPIIVAMVALVAVLIVGLIAANAVTWDGAPRFYDPVVIVPNVVVGLLIALMTATVGVAVSLRARRVQAAQQTLSLMLLLPAMVMGGLLFIAAQLSGGVIEAAEQLDGLSGWVVAGAVVAILVAVDAVLLALARRRFRRSRLIALT